MTRPGKNLYEAEDWYCAACGEKCKPFDGKWRWNGEEWEHYHPYPVGHCLCERREPK